jgi:L-iditol 2-dehydrogenase
MRAAVLHGKEHIRVEEIPPAVRRVGEARVQIQAALTCGTDLNLVASFHHTPRTVRRALEFIEAGVVCADDFVDGECSLSELPTLFRSMVSGNRAVKMLVRVQE